MATKPIIKPVTPFDVADGYRLTATYSGNMPYYNRVIVQDAITQVIVYDRTIQTSEYAHTLDPNYKGSVVAPGDVGYALENGHRYSATIQFFGRTLADAGLVSDKCIFLTRTTPQFYFDDLNDGDIIEAASIMLNLVYTQEEAEKLLNFRFYIYDHNKHLLQQTDILYDTTNLSYSFKGLENETSYYVRATGTTIHGIPLDTDFIEIIVRYENPSVYARMYVECDPNTSEMNYRTNFVLIEADEGEDFKYEDGYIFLNGKTVTYSKGYEIEGDATWHIRAKDMDYEKVFFKTFNADGIGFYLEGIRDTDVTLRFRLVVPGALSDYILYSQNVNIDWTDVVNIWIRRVGNLYTMKVFVEPHPLVIGALYLDPNEPTMTNPQNEDLWFDLNENPPVEVMSYDVRIYHQDTEPQNANQYSIWVD